MRVHTKETQANLSPELALEILKEGNVRFVSNIKAHRNLLQQVNETSEGQFPFAAILSCIDSRTSAELIFDQGLGDVFSIRIAGNILNDDILGSMEYACKNAGSKLVVVLGHTGCGAIKAACSHTNTALGHIATLINKIKPAIQRENETKTDRTSSNKTFVRNVTKNNIFLVLQQIRAQSDVLAEMEETNQIKIVGGLHDIETGKVIFFEKW
jgi:carbonic anhydrase